jgi:acetyl esterase/lipase
VNAQGKLHQHESNTRVESVENDTGRPGRSTSGDSKTFNAGRDILPVGLMNTIVGKFYLGTIAPKQPAASPLYADFHSDFPPSIIVTGTRDLLMSDSVRLHSKLMSNSIKTELVVEEGMWHGFPMDEEMPESVEAMNEAVRFLARSGCTR